MTGRPPVSDWAADFDHNHIDWSNDPHAIWNDLKARCPVAHTERYRGVYLPLDTDVIREIAYDPAHFSSRRISILENKPPISAPIPPVTSDPPVHRAQRMMLLAAFTPDAIAKLAPITRGLCNELIDGFIAQGRCDAAADYARHVPTRVISIMLGLEAKDGDRFAQWIRDLDLGIEDNDIFKRVIGEIDTFFADRIAERRDSPPRDDLIGFLMGQRIDGEPLSREHMLGTLRLLLIAGIDTTWSAIGATLLHLAQTPEHTARLVADPGLMPTAIEEFLRIFAPVSVARLIVEDKEIAGCPFHKGQMVLLPYPTINRDPALFDTPGDVVLDRKVNRHVTFGLGIHRCIGSNLARMELTVAVEEWLKRIPAFTLADDSALNWSRGLVRGPRHLPVVFARG